MAEEGKEYYLVDEQNTKHTSSRNFTGHATAHYPNGDVYVGQFLSGVSIGIKHSGSILFFEYFLYTMLSYNYILDAPYCKPDQVQVFGVARDETARIACEVIANPQSSVYFEWKFNTSGIYYLKTLIFLQN